MASVVISILGDATGARRAFADLRAEGERTTAALGGATRHGSADRRRLEAEEIAETRRQLRAQQQARLRALRERQRAEEAATRQRERAAKAELAAHVKAERERTRSAARESKLREQLARREASEKTRLDRETTRTHEREERRRTQLAEQEARKRVRAQVRAERERRQRFGQIGNAVVTGGRAAGQFAGDVHGQFQDARRTVAQQETALNTTLIQTVPSGATQQEIAGTRAHIMQRIRHDQLNPDAVIDVLGQAQSFANALGGDTAQQRRANVDATLDDVQFAADIDPENMSGLVRLGALARGRMNTDDRRTLLRSFAGIGFQGSVETDETIQQGLRGLQEAWSSGTANITDPAEMSRRRLEIARDFAAQVQSQAASGRSVNVSANRSNTVITSLANEDRQDRLGRAYARRRRTMTDAERTLFDATFTRDPRGHWHMNESVRSSASNAARFFGTMHGNNATDIRNFLGARGGGGAQQLMHKPDVDALVSYLSMATNSRGQQVRQYDYVDELSRTTITPEQESVIRGVRKSEASRKLQDEENARVEALTTNTRGLNDLSNAFAGWAARNPLEKSALDAGGSVLSGLVTGGVVGKVLGRATPTGGATGLLGTLGARFTSMASSARSVLPSVSSVSSLRSLAPPLVLASLLKLGGSYGGVEQGDVERQNREGAEWERQSTRLTERARAMGQAPPTASEIGAAVAAALRAQPIVATVDPHDARHAASASRSP